jgi:hypothetical protein
MKVFTCLVHLDSSKLHLLNRVLHSQEFLFDEVHVSIITNKFKENEWDLILSALPPQSKRFKVEIVNRQYETLPSPWLLAWIHKTLMHEKFQDDTYSHFLNIEDDIEISQNNIEYWLKTRIELRNHNLYPSFLRVEFNETKSEWVSVDAIKGDKFSIAKLPRLTKTKEYGFINLPRTYQGMFLYDRELMQEYIYSGKYVIDEAFPQWRYALQYSTSPLGLGEASHDGLSQINVPEGFFSRNLLPCNLKYQLIDPCCFVHHIHDKYTNIEASDHGKVSVNQILQK